VWCFCCQVKAWCYYESRVLGAHHGLISTYALETLVLYIFNRYHRELHSPLEVWGTLMGGQYALYFRRRLSFQRRLSFLRLRRAFPLLLRCSKSSSRCLVRLSGSDSA